MANNIHRTYNVDYGVFDDTAGLPAGYWLWMWVYVDPVGNTSRIKYSLPVEVAANQQVVFYNMPTLYSGELDSLEWYRSSTVLTKIEPQYPSPGQIVDGVTYIVYDSNPATNDTIDYNGITYEHGSMFTGIAAVDDYSRTSAEIAVYELPTRWEYIKNIENDALGIALDDYTKHGHDFKDKGGEYNYESGIRWSEAYRPNHIRLENMIEFRSGDGKQITGLAVLYGNLVVFKETSIGRYAVQGEKPPISRVDEVACDVGCISPNALTQIDNTLYFLSWNGLYKYDNNVLTPIDMKFSEELQFRLKYLRQHGMHIIRKISIGYNAVNSEIWLNIPHTGSIGGANSYSGLTKYYTRDREIRGHIYVVNEKEQYCTKFAYANYPGCGVVPTEFPFPLPPMLNMWPRTTYSHSTLYYRNSYGELISAEVGEHYATWPFNPALPIPQPGKIPAGIFVESPTELEEDYMMRVESFIDTDNNISLSPNYLSQTQIEIRNLWRSKHFTQTKEHNIKRVRKVSLNRWSRAADSKVSIFSMPFDLEDDRIDEDGYVTAYTFTPGSNIITVIPDTVYDGENEWLEDAYGKPIRAWVQYEGAGRTHINAMSLWWRLIHPFIP